MQIAHTTRCCGSCSMWSGQRTLKNPTVDPRKYTILIEASTSPARCNFTQMSNGFSPTQGCGQYRAMFGS